MCEKLSPPRAHTHTRSLASSAPRQYNTLIHATCFCHFSSHYDTSDGSLHPISPAGAELRPPPLSKCMHTLDPGCLTSGVGRNIDTQIRKTNMGIPVWSKLKQGQQRFQNTQFQGLENPLSMWMTGVNIEKVMRSYMKSYYCEM